jgi:hypothetical protein
MKHKRPPKLRKKFLHKYTVVSTGGASHADVKKLLARIIRK